MKDPDLKPDQQRLDDMRAAIEKALGPDQMAAGVRAELGPWKGPTASCKLIDFGFRGTLKNKQ
jgi:hypothetical protein